MNHKWFVDNVEMNADHLLQRLTYMRDSTAKQVEETKKEGKSSSSNNNADTIGIRLTGGNNYFERVPSQEDRTFSDIGNTLTRGQNKQSFKDSNRLSPIIQKPSEQSDHYFHSKRDAEQNDFNHFFTDFNQQ